MQKRPLNVAVVARLRFIVEQTLFTLRNFTHKSANQLDTKILKLPNFYREKTNNDIRHSTTPAPTAYRNTGSQKESPRPQARMRLYSTRKLVMRKIYNLKKNGYTEIRHITLTANI